MRPATPRVDPVLEGDLEGLLHRRGPVGGEEDSGGRRPGTTAASASASSTTTVLPLPSRVRVGDAVELPAQGGVELGDPVAEGGDPERGDGVEVAAAVDVDELATLGVVDDDRGVVGVGGHLGEAVPDDGGVAGCTQSGCRRPVGERRGHRPQTWERPRSTTPMPAPLDVGRVDATALEDGRRRGLRRPRPRPRGRGRPPRRWRGWPARRAGRSETMSAARRRAKGRSSSWSTTWLTRPHAEGAAGVDEVAGGATSPGPGGCRWPGGGDGQPHERVDADPGVGVGEAGPVRGHQEVAVEGQLEATGHGHAVDGSDDRLRRGKGGPRRHRA